MNEHELTEKIFTVPNTIIGIQSLRQHADQTIRDYLEEKIWKIIDWSTCLVKDPFKDGKNQEERLQEILGLKKEEVKWCRHIIKCRNKWCLDGMNLDGMLINVVVREDWDKCPFEGCNAQRPEQSPKEDGLDWLRKAKAEQEQKECKFHVIPGFIECIHCKKALSTLCISNQAEPEQRKEVPEKEERIQRLAFKLHSNGCFKVTDTEEYMQLSRILIDELTEEKQ